MKAERLEVVQDSFVIRFHHLVLWWDFASAYLTKFGSGYPWETKDNDLQKIFDFTDSFIDDDVQRWSYARNYLEDNIEGNYEAKKLKYLYDLHGPTDETLMEASESRKKVYMNFLNLSVKSPDTQIELTVEKDNYCNTCSVGKHCNRGVVAKFIRNDRDYVFRKAVSVMVRDRKFEHDLGLNDKNKFFITPRLIFDKKFFDSLFDQIRQNGDGDWI